MGRSIAREVGFKSIYQIAYGQDIESAIVKKDDEKNIALVDLDDEMLTLDTRERKFAKDLAEGVNNNISKIDEIILSKLTKWTIDRIFRVDLAILRVAVYELLFAKKAPYKVVANEAIELCKKYGSDESSNFVNGVLREVIKDIELEGNK